MSVVRSGAWAWLVSLATVVGTIAPAGTAEAAQGAEVAVSAGGYDIAKAGSLEAGFEYRLRSRAWGLVPLVGAVGTEEGDFYAYAGLRLPVRLASKLRLIPGFAVSLYEEGGSGKDLGGPLQFRSSLELARRFAGGSSLGLVVYHLSNASIYEDNPGANSVVLSWTLPLASR